MKILKNVATYKSNKKTFVTIGTFDGVHLGHQKVIKNLVESARLTNTTSVLLTFFPHPRMVLQNNTNIKLINTINERIQILEKTGLEVLIIQEFTEEFSNYTALDFVKNILVDTLHIDTLIIGYDHKFGKNRKGDFQQLESYGEKFGFNVQEISKKEIANFTISSTKIRNALELGEIEKVTNYLGYPYMLTGTVVQGKNLGEKIGYPTANIQIKETYKLLPKTGAYVVQSSFNNSTIFGMMNIGYRPTVSGKNQTIEVHFFDFNENLYDTVIQIDVLAFLREEQKFDSVESLKYQLAKDKETSLEIINGLLFDS
ncbi:MAG: bifunctional riboflavin kinase/FAD synthetase [Lutibacter sp.]|uniref:bifunctional riboflavin kinase/FAD synthetase n=1 Tax=Lutibacter sp. TaxID=1925666 RepID=UPI0018321600|nr:bifunctional riboflavin kinase/FAD synthetase [Lutibacter sp.]MBT8318237.1 bifunctional riboflavin kinase/FAD synthetase [Lutibacter sp.]NNJ59096.1 bifunctional riboflavin kinase/FAD synthetase [Lutibacter sp.]